VNETDTRSQAKVYRGKKTKKIYSQDDYEKSSFKDIIEDREDTKDNVLETVVAKVKKNFQAVMKQQKIYCMVMKSNGRGKIGYKKC
jgi:hypothetical protein